MNRRYYILIGVDPVLADRGELGRFEIIFGDYSRDVVAEEKIEEKYNGYYKRLRIVATDDSQEEIDALVSDLNLQHSKKEK